MNRSLGSMWQWILGCWNKGGGDEIYSSDGQMHCYGLTIKELGSDVLVQEVEPWETYPLQAYQI